MGRKWGQKYVVDNDLYDIIHHKASEETMNKYNEAVRKFAHDALVVDLHDATINCNRCKLLESKREDVFYIIDHTNLNGFEKFFLKIRYLVWRV
jgi:hypothetical protein